ncbi:ABC-type multidrug transport system, permease component [Alteracholeplasma palmae J233]|uniref:ABC-type multidrug transport system, permease component n=1 Tax=Alteracholeplasma palmae (strain ATCC 49389 / J233) TaxID=1318466 RepID=U4KK12_ALTPJ|nr:ABC transporter permease [Alteracholeplasma palmae]CCV63934.1 ABC-type multidrug transport system, permease component [Alteracholeplasma palmae J233]
MKNKHLEPINNVRNYLHNIWELTKRNMRIFLKNKTSVLFSMLAPVLILVIYILFMGEFQVDMIANNLPESVEVSRKSISSITHAWMLSGIVGISSLTVALNSMFIAISDKERRVIDDFTASPVKLVNLTLSYFISAFILTFVICFLFLIIGIIYLIIATGVGFTFLDLFSLFGILILSTLSAVIVLMCITTFFKTTSAASSFTGIFSALVGFLIGAYLPVSILPKGIQNFANLIPGSHSTGLFRTVFMKRMIESLPEGISPEFIEQIKGTYGFDLQIFGAKINSSHMYLYLTASIFVFFIAYLVINKWIKKK